MSWLGRLLGTSDAIKEMIQIGKDVVDEFHYSDEEKAHDKAAATSEARSMVIEWLRHSQGQNISRRVIALSVTGIWLFMHVMSSGVAIGAVWAKEPVNLIATATVIDHRLESLTPAIMLILGFYFAAPYLGDIAEASLKKFGRLNSGEEK